MNPSLSTPNAILVSIGTELTEGQITNRNATTISQWLTALGFKVIRHETVADDSTQMMNTFKRVEKDCDLLVVTGGLGPTSDDFTRNIISDFIEKKLIWNEEAWNKIDARLKSRGIEVPESNKIQAFFPESAIRLENKNGTADGFIVEKLRENHPEKLKIIVLPGPPKEIEGIWKTHVEEYLETQYQSLQPRSLFVWKCIGVSESVLGEIVEKALKNYNYERGYRASQPYVEVKLWLTDAELQSKEAGYARARLDEVLEPYCVAKNDGDLCEIFLASLHNFYVEEAEKGSLNPNQSYTRTLILDLGSEGLLTERLLSKLKLKKWSGLKKRIEFLTRFNDPTTLEFFPEALEGELYFGLLSGGVMAVTGYGEKKSTTLTSPYLSPELKERENAYFTEKALQYFATCLTSEFKD